MFNRDLHSRNLTVGELRRLLAHLPDSATVYPDWWGGMGKNDADPEVELDGFSVVEATPDAPGYLSVSVSLYYPEDYVDEEAEVG